MAEREASVVVAIGEIDRLDHRHLMKQKCLPQASAVPLRGADDSRARLVVAQRLARNGPECGAVKWGMDFPFFAAM